MLLLLTRADFLVNQQKLQDSINRVERAVSGRGPSNEAYGAGYPGFTAKNKSLLKKHLSVNVYEALKDRVTPNGFTLERAIQSGVDNQDSGVGLYAGDEVWVDVLSMCIVDIMAGLLHRLRPSLRRRH